MSRVFTKNTANWMGLGVNTLGTLINGAAKIAFHAFIKAASFSTGVNDNTIIGIFNGGDISGPTIRINGSGSSAVLRIGARSNKTDTFQTKDGTTKLNLGVWYSVGGVVDFAAATIQPYLNGQPEGGGSVTFGNATYLNQATVSVNDGIGDGGNHAATASQFDGAISQVTIWQFGAGIPGLEPRDWLDLAAGKDPRRIQPGYLAVHFPLTNQTLAGPEYDDVGQKTGTITGSIPMSTDPQFTQQFDFPPYLMAPQISGAVFPELFTQIFTQRREPNQVVAY